MAPHPAPCPRNGRRPHSSGRGSFLAAAVRSPRDVGTLLPSGPELARRLAAVVPRSGSAGRPTVIVELGAGDGAVTGAIVERAGPGAVVIAVEKDPELAERLRDRALGVRVVTADAAALPAILAKYGLRRADVIVSMLPWTLLRPQQQRDYLATFSAALDVDGVFTAAAYSSGYWTPSARRFRGALGATFGEVLPTRTMWRHVPPAMTYVCRRPFRPDEGVNGSRNR
ncbi:MAG: class I SAM-dependent methyltransferase [Pseudonocardiaceae bacterium]